MENATIEVTQRDICLASPFRGHPWRTPVGYALARHYDLVSEDVAMSSDSVVVERSVPADGQVYLIELPQDARELIEKFMRYEPVFPMRFEAKPVFYTELVESRRDRWLASQTSALLFHRIRIGDIRRNEVASTCVACRIGHAGNTVRFAPYYLMDENESWENEFDVCDYVVNALMHAVESVAPVSDWRNPPAEVAADMFIEDALYANAFA